MIVMKFGGTSLGGSGSIERACSIIERRKGRNPLVVVSATGDTTDRLVDAAEAGGAAGQKRLEAVRDTSLAIARDVVGDRDLPDAAAFLDALFGEAADLLRALDADGPERGPSAALDALLAIGERASSRVIALALRQAGVDAAHLDARGLIVTDARAGGANALFPPTSQRLRAAAPPLLAEGRVPVMGGFIATDEDGGPTTLGRGGSDCTASLVGAALGAEEVQIWTDVDGVMTADPTLVATARSLPALSLAEASELAYFGVRVLHPSTMLPAIDHSIAVRVLNSMRPASEGTLIVKDPPKSDPVVKSVVYKEGITLIDISSTRMLMAHGFLARIFAVFDRHETAVDMVSTSEVSVSLTVDQPARLAAILRDLREFSHAEARPGKAIVCVVGEGIRYTPGIAAKVFNALEGIRVQMISLGASRVNVGFVIGEDEVATAVRRLHATFFDAPAPQAGGPQ